MTSVKKQEKGKSMEDILQNSNFDGEPFEDDDSLDRDGFSTICGTYFYDVSIARITNHPTTKGRMYFVHRKPASPTLKPAVYKDAEEEKCYRLLDDIFMSKSPDTWHTDLVFHWQKIEPDPEQDDSLIGLAMMLGFTIYTSEVEHDVTWYKLDDGIGAEMITSHLAAALRHKIDLMIHMASSNEIDAKREETMRHFGLLKSSGHQIRPVDHRKNASSAKE
jgi:hypothetical protein